MKTAEYPSIGKITKKGLELLGLSYSLNNYSHKKIIMVYPNKIKIDFILQKMKKNLIKYRSNFSENVKIGLGTIAHGSFKSEGFLKPKDLEKELSFYKKNNFDSIVIFRLGGLNQSYLKKIKKFL